MRTLSQRRGERRERRAIPRKNSNGPPSSPRGNGIPSRLLLRRDPGEEVSFRRYDLPYRVASCRVAACVASMSGRCVRTAVERVYLTARQCRVRCRIKVRLVVKRLHRRRRGERDVEDTSIRTRVEALDAFISLPGAHLERYYRYARCVITALHSVVHGDPSRPTHGYNKIYSLFRIFPPDRARASPHVSAASSP